MKKTYKIKNLNTYQLRVLFSMKENKLIDSLYRDKNHVLTITLTKLGIEFKKFFK